MDKKTKSRGKGATSGLLSVLKDSAKLCFADYRYFLSSFLIDMLFFFAFAVTYSFFSIKIMGHLFEVSGLMSGLSGSITAIGSAGQGMNETAISELISRQEILTENFKSILILAFGAIVSLYILWVIIQGFNWKLAAGKASKEVHKMKLLKYLGQFSLISAIWVLVSLVLAYAVVQISVYNDFAKIMIVSQDTLNILALLLFIALSYFIAVSYSLVGKMKTANLIKKTFVLGVKKVGVFLPAILFVLLVFTLVILMVSLLNLGLVTTVLVDLILLLPAVLFGRMLMIVCAEE